MKALRKRTKKEIKIVKEFLEDYDLINHRTFYLLDKESVKEALE